MSFINSLMLISPQEFTTTTGDNDNVDLSSTQLWVTVTTDNDNLTGMIPPMSMDGYMCWVWNRSAANTLVIQNNDAGSTAGYRFSLAGSTTLTLESNQGQLFMFVSGTGWVPVKSGTFA